MELPGGMGNRGQVVRVGNTVRRPRGPQSTSVRRLLAHLVEHGFPAPRPLGDDDEGRDVFAWIDGDVPVPPFPAWSRSDDALASVGVLVRRLHDALGSFRASPDDVWNSELAEPIGGPLVCHNDVCPENVIFRGGEAVALLDFDFASQAVLSGILPRPLGCGSRSACRATAMTASRSGGLASWRTRMAWRKKTTWTSSTRSSPASGRQRVCPAQGGGGERPFVDLWAARGGGAGDAAIVAWLARTREAFANTLGKQRLERARAAVCNPRLRAHCLTHCPARRSPRLLPSSRRSRRAHQNGRCRRPRRRTHRPRCKNSCRNI